MKSSKKKIIIHHEARDLYNIVLDIENYPDFIPWCKKIEIKSKNSKEILADMHVSYKFFFPQVFTSKVLFNDNKLSIKTKYIEGPLKDLDTEWNFKKVESNKTHVFFDVNFEFRKFHHQKIAEFFFILIEKKMIDSFIKRADDILN